ncbi:hypothetical protein CKY20_01580 [Capnocytophaga canis]|uniref:HYR domain-containing protein n=1 Tax=Capnocytophaga canis TaxID=1848903 RepID=A0A3A1YPL5_9FLAO|nr:T9SS type B sorting domain-containing protein [Capnocytophaga canis]RIY38264.1 hypothetical protein CKY20_01580 [Capnocytophaga canis]
MKNLLLTFVFLCTVWVTQAQTPCIDSFTATPTPGSCFSDATLKVELPAGCTGNYLAVLTPPEGTGNVEYQQLTGTPASYTFNALRAGTYTVTVMDQDSGTQTAPKIVNVTSSYVIMNIQEIKQSPPTCLTQRNGKITFRIPTGGTGSFRVSVEDPNGNVLYAPEDFARPTGSNVISIEGSGSNSIPLGNVVLVIEDLAGGAVQCGETRRIPMVMTGTIVQNYECLGVGVKPQSFERDLSGVCKYRMTYSSHLLTGGGYIYSNLSGAERTVLDNLMKQPGTFVVENVTKGTIKDFSSSFSGGWYYTDYTFEENDEIKVRVRVNIPTVPPIFERDDHFKFEEVTQQAVPHLSYSISRTADCIPVEKLYIYVNKYNGFRTYNHLMFPTDNNKRMSFHIRWAVKNNTDLMNHVDVYKFDEGTNTWTGPLTTGIIKSNNHIDVTAHGAGKYKVKYRLNAHEGCYPDAEKEVEIKVPPLPKPPLENTMNVLQPGLGIYEGTGYIYNYFYGNNMKLHLARTDGQTSVSFQTKLPLETDTYTRTVKFPIEFTNNGGTRSIGDLPPGEYIVTVTDACGNIASKTLTVTGRLPIKYQETITKDCQLGTYTYNFDRNDPLTRNMQATLQRKTVNASGVVTWVSMTTTHPRISGYTNTFVNIPTGEYRVEFYNYYYTYIAPNGSKSSHSGYSFLEEALNGNPYFHGSTYAQNFRDYAYFEIKEQEIIDPDIISSSCDASTPAYVAVNINNPHVISYPLTYSLINPITNAVVASQTYSSGGTSHVFSNIPTGKYKVITAHRCGSVPKDVEVLANNFYPPRMIPLVNRPDVCSPANVILNFTGIESLYDIRWFKLDEQDNRVGGALHTGRVFLTTVTKTTTFEVEYNLKQSIICNQGEIKSLRRTITIPHDDEAPVVAPMPDITQRLPLGRCLAPVSWTVSATDNCPPVTVSSTHTPGDEFPLGVTTVTYTFTDLSGNTTTRTFLVTVLSNALDLSLTSRYVNGSNTPLSELSPTSDAFLYEIRYRNSGGEHITTATMTVVLPSNSNVTLDGSPMLTAASIGSFVPTYTYDTASRTYQFVIPGETLRQASAERIIRIPLRITGGCEQAIKPCLDHLLANTSVVFGGGPAGCSLAPQMRTHTATIKINTDSCQRQELFCGEEVVLTSTEGFDSYQWYKNGVAIPGANTASLTSSGAGIYKVIKTNTCSGITVTNSETVNLVAPAVAIDPIRALANNIGMVCSNNGLWTSLFFLCESNSRVLTVSFQNTNFIWQRANGSCPAPFQGCPYSDESCWEDVSSNNSFTISSAGKYRLKIKDANCNTSYYFDVITNGLSGDIPSNLVGHQSDYSQGYFSVVMSATGVNYNMKLYKDNALERDITTGSNSYQFTNLTAGNYRIVVTSPQIQGCKYEDIIKIDKRTEMTMTASFLGWTQCNTARVRFSAEGGKPPYRFAIWSINGIEQYASEELALQNAVIATLPENQTFIEAEIPNITHVGEYVFIAGDQRNGAFALSTPPLLIEPPVPHNFKLNVNHIQCASAPNEGSILLNFASQQNRSVRLYRLNPDYTRNGVPIQQNSTGTFLNLPVGLYETEVIATISGTTCTYIKKPIEIKPSETTIKAFIGVVADKDCDTRIGISSKQYKIAVNNVSGGEAPYEYSFDGEANYSIDNIGYISNSMRVYVKDRKGCKQGFDIVVAPAEIPTIEFSPISYRCDNGYGVVTVTMSATSSNSYEYRVGSTENYQTVSGTSFMLTLEPNTHLVQVRYVTQSNIASKNLLFQEDFGSGADICMPNINNLTCRENQTLFDGEYAITQQVATNANWVNPTPTDPTGGRYLAVMGNGNNEIIYKKRISGFVTNTSDAHLQFDVRSLLLNTGTNANLYVELRTTTGVVLSSQHVGNGNIPHGGNWETHKVTFPKNTIKENTLDVVIINKANSSVGNLGNDVAIDNIEVWQDTQHCEAMVSKPITIEKNKQLYIEKIAETNVRCKGSSDGTLTIKVNNPPASRVIEYAIGSQVSWTTVTLTTTNNTFVATGLPVTTNGVIFVRDANQPSCMVDFTPYTIGNAIPIVVKAEVVKKVTCGAVSGATVLVTATGGNPSSYNYQLGPTAFTSNNQFVNISAGTYTVTVRDGNGCEESISLIIEDKKSLTITAETIYCYDGIGNGSVHISVTEGNGGYRFQRVGDANMYTSVDDSYLFTGLSVGNHTFTVTDNAGCSATVTATVYPPMRLQVTENNQYIGCTTGATVTFTLTAMGGDPLATKEFRVSNDGGATYTNFASATSNATYITSTPGDYRFMVIYFPNGEACEAIVERKVIYDPPRFLNPSVTTQEAFCGQNNGAIIVKPSDFYSSTASNTVNVFKLDATGNRILPAVTPTVLAIGSYLVEITDNRGCVVTTTVTVPGVEAMTATATQITPISCRETGGLKLAEWQVSVNRGGTPPFTVKVESTSNGYSRTQSLASHSAIGTFNGLDFGQYNAIVTDLNGCEVTIPFDVLANANFILTTQVATPTACATTGTVSVTAFTTITGGLENATQGYWFAIYQPGIENMLPTTFTGSIQTVTHGTRQTVWHKHTAQTVSGSVTTSAGITFTGLVPGVEYTFTMYNSATGCYYTQRANIPVPTFSTLTSTITVAKPTTCSSANDGSVEFSVLGGWQGTTHFINAQVYNYIGNTEVTGATQTFVPGSTATIFNLPAGRYYIVFTEQDNSGNDTCVNASKDFIIEKATIELSVSATPMVNATCSNDGLVRLNFNGGKAPYKYDIVTGSTVPTYPLNTHATTVVIPQGTATWTVYVRDAYGCTKSTTVFVPKDEEPQIGTADVMLCSTDPNTLETPVRISMNQLGIGNHFYTLETGSGVKPQEPITWDASGNAFSLNLEAGSYTITIRDGNNCTSTTTFVVNELIQYTANISSVATCRTTVPSVEIGVSTPTGGTGNYFYILERIEEKGTASETATVLLTGAYTPTITILNPAYGNYRIAVYDNNTTACPIYKDLQIQEPVKPNIADATLVATPLTCDPNVGEIIVSMPNSDPAGFTFAIVRMEDLTSGGMVTTTVTAPTTADNYTANFKDLRGTVAGVRYTIRVVSNDNDCYAERYITLTAPEPLSLQNEALTASAYACAGNGRMNPATLTFDMTKVKGGTPPYQATFYDATTNAALGNGNSYTLPDLNGGTFYMMITDQNGCTVSSTTPVTVTPTFSLEAITVTITQSITCSRDEQIGVEVSVLPSYLGTNLNYILRNIDTETVVTQTTITSTSHTFVGLGMGNYEIKVVNLSTGCELTSTHRVDNPNTFEVMAENIVRPTCYGDSGSVSLRFVDVALGNGNQAIDGFTYTITSVINSTEVYTGTMTTDTTGIINLKSGAYEVIAKSLLNDCETSPIRLVIPQSPPKIEIHAIETYGVTCDNNKGEVQITIKGGEAPFKVELIGSGTPIAKTDISQYALFTGLSADNYTISVTDAVGCTMFTGTTSLTLLQPNSVSATISVTHITCIGDQNGIITVNASGGSGEGTYYYALYKDNVLHREPQTSNVFSGLGEATYFVEIIDAWNCGIRTSPVNIYEPSPMNVEIIRGSSRFSVCHGEENAYVRVNVIGGGTAPYRVSVVHKDSFVEVGSYSNVNPGTELEFKNNNIGPGNYEIRMTDANECLMQNTVSFTVVEFPDLTIRHIEQQGTCVDNQYSDYIEVGFAIELDFSKLYYTLNGSSTKNTFSNTTRFAGRIYDFDRTIKKQQITVYYEDTVLGLSESCSITADPFTVYNVLPLTLERVTDMRLNTIEVIAEQGTPQYTFYFNGKEQGENSVYVMNINDPQRIEDGKIIKIIEVMVQDSAGCTRTMTIEQEYFDITIPNYFTPDGDGINDSWKPRNMENFANSNVHIYDRYGRRIKTLQFVNGVLDEWDGNYNHKPVPSGDYWYIIEINRQDDNRRFIGHFTLYR